MLKRILIVATMATMVIAATACAPKPADTAADEATMKADLDNWFTGYNAGDADGVAKLYAEDGVLMAPGAPAVSGRSAIKDFFATDIPKTKAAGLTLSVVNTTGMGVSGDFAWLSGTYSAKDASGAEKDKGKFLSVYHRGADGMKMIRDTWNSDMEPAPAAAAPAAAPAADAAGAAPAKP